jgi:transcriptional regulator with XRE-family HTH domain
MTTPGQVLRDARRRHGVTQAQLGVRARTSQAAVSRIERDVVSPSIATLSYLLGMLNEELVLTTRDLDWGHDRTLIRDNLGRSVDERLERGIAFSRFAAEHRSIAPARR